MTTNALPSPDTFPMKVPITIRFRDLDAMGHVNNSVYITYLEEARVAYYRLLTGHELDPATFDFVIAEITCTYRSPAHLGEILEVAIRVSEVRSRSFVFEYVITERESKRLVATGRSVQVAYDYTAGQVKTLSDEMIARME
ncbi:MAG: acyl-CoA thioesterase, partial [Anaerolineae bacterium]|nr:acyl-CoA thioesterase [Anaerolineae bacterium]